MIILFCLIITLLTVILIFASPKLSPIPYFPSNHHDIRIIIKALSLRENQTIIDLGAGDGMVIFKAAQEALINNLNTKFVAIDINPILVLIMNIRRIFHPNKKNITIIHGDMFSIDYKKFLTFNFSLPSEALAKEGLLTLYLYISPWLLEKTLSKIKQIPGKKNIVSYFYPIKSLKPHTHTNGIHNLYTYTV